MKKLSNFLCIILSATMLLSLLSVSVSAQTAVTVFNITVDEPTVGQELATTASLPETASTYVSKLRWTGDLDENGKVKADTEYTVYLTVALKEGMDDKVIKKPSKNTVKVNGKVAMMTTVFSSAL